MTRTRDEQDELNERDYREEAQRALDEEQHAADLIQHRHEENQQ